MPNRSPPGSHLPRWQRIARFLELERLLELFAAHVAALAVRRPDKPVAAETLADARVLIAEARSILSRERVSKTLFVLDGTPSWAGLSTRLVLIRHSLRLFRENHYVADEGEWLSVEQAARYRAEHAHDSKALEHKSAPF